MFCLLDLDQMIIIHHHRRLLKTSQVVGEVILEVQLLVISHRANLKQLKVAGEAEADLVNKSNLRDSQVIQYRMMALISLRNLRRE